jgi:cytochrome c peroxidase
VINNRFAFLLWALALAGLVSLFLAVPQSESSVAPAFGAALFVEPTRGAIQPVPSPPIMDAAKVALGRALFHDARLSHDDSIACANCHDVQTGGHDPSGFSIGVGGAVGIINSPTVFNASLNFAQFWDGRSASLEEQAHGPVHNPIEMASSWDEVIPKLRADAAFMRQFEAVYPAGLSPEAIVDAISAYERSLLTPDAPFDRFLRGETTAIDTLSREGYRLFTEIGCVSCHQGVNIGGNMYQRFGVLGDYFKDRAAVRPIQPADYGRFNVTGLEEDRFVFKVPGLRNVALTGPYFHDASAETLQDAVAIIGRFQLGRTLSASEIDAIVAFLHSLTGKNPEQAQP